MAWTQAIIRLQEVDSTLAENRQRLKEIERLLGESDVVAEAEAVVARRRKAATEARKAQETLEFELGQVQTKQSRSEHNLYSGRITNARELQDLQAESQSLKRRIAQLEDELLAAMMAREEADAATAAAEAHLTEVRDRMARHHAGLAAEAKTLEAANQALVEERALLVAEIPPSVLDSYAYLQDRTSHVPVAQLKGEICGVCGMVVTKPIQQTVRRGQEAYCNNCGRLLVG
jgi:hypothetical protein